MEMERESEHLSSVLAANKDEKRTNVCTRLQQEILKPR